MRSRLRSPGGMRSRRSHSRGTHTCALDVEARTFCWGANFLGQAGQDPGVVRTTPLPMSVEGRYASLAAGGSHVCALDDKGRAFCWGENHVGQLGNGGTARSFRPVAVVH